MVVVLVLVLVFDENGEDSTLEVVVTRDSDIVDVSDIADVEESQDDACIPVEPVVVAAAAVVVVAETAGSVELVTSSASRR